MYLVLPDCLLKPSARSARNLSKPARNLSKPRFVIDNAELDTSFCTEQADWMAKHPRISIESYFREENFRGKK